MNKNNHSFVVTKSQASEEMTFTRRCLYGVIHQRISVFKVVIFIVLFLVSWILYHRHVQQLTTKINTENSIFPRYFQWNDSHDYDANNVYRTATTIDTERNNEETADTTIAVLNLHVKSTPQSTLSLQKSISSEDYLSINFALETFFTNNVSGMAPKGRTNLGYSRASENHTPLKMVLVLSMGENLLDSYLKFFFEKLRIMYTNISLKESIPPLLLVGVNKPLYSLIVITDYVSFLMMPSSARSQIEDYCKKYSVGILGLINNVQRQKTYKIDTLNLQDGVKLQGFKLNPDSEIWRVAKKDKIYTNNLDVDYDWTVISSTDETFQPLVYSTAIQGAECTDDYSCVIAVHDMGLRDGIQRVLFGNTIKYWLSTIVAMDAVDYLSHGRFRLPLERYIQLDVDDTFVGDPNDWLTDTDVDAMVSSQDRIRQMVPNFTYFLGFSAHGVNQNMRPNETLGVKRQLEVRHKFPWFNHMYEHLVVTKARDDAEIYNELKRNHDWAKESDIPEVIEYMAAPKNAGIYPVFEALYSLWNIIGVRFSSTTEYPHKRPIFKRRGFVYRGIKVIPRYFCNMNSRDSHFSDLSAEYKTNDTEKAIKAYIMEGEFFKSLLTTPVMVFMTHYPNFGHERLAQYQFENGFRHLLEWTNLQLIAPTPPKIVDIYFQLYPSEEDLPLWGNPCSDDSHMAIKSPSVTCEKIPDFFIVGPPRTGSTSLLCFLDTHPNVEGTQCHGHTKVGPDYNFFSGDTYGNGLEWYLQLFSLLTAKERAEYLILEKGSKYFASPMAARRIHTLNPKAKIIILSSDPAERAYSWYLYIKFRNLSEAKRHSFYEVLTASDEASPALKELRDQCLLPGLYAVNMARYLYYFKSHQILVLDSDQLSMDPLTVVTDIYRFLRVKEVDGWTNKFKYNKEQGRFCTVNGCVEYTDESAPEPVDERSQQFLIDYYKDPNEDFATLLEKLNYSRPRWLDRLAEHGH